MYSSSSIIPYNEWTTNKSVWSFHLMKDRLIPAATETKGLTGEEGLGREGGGGGGGGDFSADEDDDCRCCCRR